MKPLAGLRCLSVEQFAAAPYGTMFLADLGAEVIRIENPLAGGDVARRGPFASLGENDSVYFQGWNSNKRSVSLDIKSEEGRARFERLVGTADVLVNNLRGDVPAKLRLDYASLASIKPDIVCLHISAYGRNNERADRPGYDFLMQAESGLMSLTGEPDGPPARFGASIIDHMSGIMGALGVLACVFRARQTGQGCDVDVSLFDVALHQLSYSANWYLNDGTQSTRLARSAHLGNAPVQTFKAADGWIFLMCMSDKFWSLLLRELPATGLNNDPRFATNALRMQNREVLTVILDEEFGKATAEEWVARLGRFIPIAPVYDLERALASPFVASIGMVSSVPHPERGDLLLLANPIKIDGRRLSQRACSPLGADNAELLDHEIGPTTAIKK